MMSEKERVNVDTNVNIKRKIGISVLEFPFLLLLATK